MDVAPQGVEGRLWISYEFADFAYKSDAEKIVARVEDFLYAHTQEFMVCDVYSYFGDNEAMTVMVLAKEDLSDPALKELRKTIRAKMPPVPGGQRSTSARRPRREAPRRTSRQALRQRPRGPQPLV